MGDITPFPEPNYTQVPNALFEMMATMSEAELKVTLAIIRKTKGWHKEQDAISLSQFQEYTGLNRNSVTTGLRKAKERGTIAECAERGPRGVKLYRLITVPMTSTKFVPDGATSTKSELVEVVTSTNSEPVTSTKFVHTKEKGKKVKESISASAKKPPSPFIQAIASIFSYPADSGICKRYASMLNGTAKSGEWKEFRCEPAVTLDELQAWDAWVKRHHKQQYGTAENSLRKPEKVQASIYQYRQAKAAYEARNKPDPSRMLNLPDPSHPDYDRIMIAELQRINGISA